MTISLVLKTAIFISLAASTLADEPRITGIGSTVQGSFSNVTFADLDQDGDQDMVTFNNLPNQGYHVWYENIDGRNFGNPLPLHYSQRANIRAEGINFDPIGNPFLLSTHSQSSSIGFPYPGTYQIITSPLLVRINHAINKPTHQYFGGPPRFISLEGDSNTQVLIPNGETLSNLTIFAADSSEELSSWTDSPLPLPPGIDAQDTEEIHDAFSADMDGDGDLDLIIQLGSNKTIIYERSGERSFAGRVHNFTGDLYPVDVDGDGDPDLIEKNHNVTNWRENDGTFDFPNSSFSFIESSAPTPLRTGTGATATKWASTDLENATLTIREWQISNGILESTLESTFDVSSLYDGSSFLQFTRMIDLDADGVEEIVSLDSRSASDFEPGQSPIPFGFTNPILVLSRNNADPAGYYQSNTRELLTGLSVHDVVVGDFNEDGSPDILAGSDVNRNFHLFFNDGRGNFDTQTIVIDFLPDEIDREKYLISGLKTVDLNSDNHLDLALTLTKFSDDAQPNNLATCTVLKGNGDGSFEPLILEDYEFDILEQFGLCDITEFVDWDSDGDLDAIIEGYWIENIDGKLAKIKRPLLQNTTTIDALGNPIRVLGHVIGDIDGDGYPDYLAPVHRLLDTHIDGFPLIVGGLGNFGRESELAVAFNDGTGGISEISTWKGNLLTNDALGAPAVFLPIPVDLNLDGASDLLVPQVTSDALGNPVSLNSHWLRLSTDTPRDLASSFSINLEMDTSSPIGDLGDFDGDGTLELLRPQSFIKPSTAGPGFSPTFDFRKNINIGKNTFYPPEKLTVIEVADFDNDGDADTLYLSGKSFTNITGRSRTDFISPIDRVTIPGIPNSSIDDSQSDTRLSLVRNLIIDERSNLQRDLRAAGYPLQQSKPHADADNDGTSNMQEVIDGTSPILDDESNPQNLTLSWSPDRQRLTFPRRKDAASLQVYYDLEASSDLRSWHRVPVEEISTDSIDEIWEFVTVSVDQSARKLQFRVRGHYDPNR